MLSSYLRIRSSIFVVKPMLSSPTKQCFLDCSISNLASTSPFASLISWAGRSISNSVLEGVIEENVGVAGS